MTMDASRAISFICIANVFSVLIAKNGEAAVSVTVVSRKTFRGELGLSRQ